MTARGERLANPLNLRHSSAKWQGMHAEQTDPEFVRFETPHYGIRAAARNLLTYARKYNLNTVEGIVFRWAPPTDHNPTEAYIETVSKALNVRRSTRLSLESPEELADLVTAMMGVEIGHVPYPASVIYNAVKAAYGEEAAPLTNQPSSVPTRKVAAASAGGLAGMPVAFLVMALWNKWMPEAPMDEVMAIAVGSGISWGLSTLMGYLTRDRVTPAV